jgi:hypothetical protein
MGNRENRVVMILLSLQRIDQQKIDQHVWLRKVRHFACFEHCGRLLAGEECLTGTVQTDSECCLLFWLALGNVMSIRNPNRFNDSVPK